LDSIASFSANRFCFPNPIKSTDHALSRNKISDIFVRDNLDGNGKEGAFMHILCGLHLETRPVSSQQTTSMTRDPWKLDSVPFTAASVRLFPGSDRTLSPWSWPLVCAHFIHSSSCYSLGLILIASPSVLSIQAKQAWGLMPACLSMCLSRAGPGPSLLSCLYRTEPRSSSLQVTRSNGTVTPL
jgi:hypothetical protein